MKKFYFYTMVVVCLLCTATIHAQDNRYWRTASGTPGNWSSSSNWSSTPGGATGATAPNGATFHVFFPDGATVNVDVAAITVNRITVSGATPTRLVASVGSVITVNNGTVGTEGLRVENVSTLESSTSANVPFSITFASGARGRINGTWLFTGDPSVVLPNGATFNVPGVSGTGTRVDIDGSMIFRDFTRTPFPGAALGQEYIFFNATSTFQLDRNGGGNPQATWAPTANYLVSGVTTLVPSFNRGTSGELGSVTWNTPNMAPIAGSMELITNGAVFQGNFSVTNTNGQPLTLLSGNAPPNMTIEGNLNISGNSVVYIGEDINVSYNLIVGGNFNLTGGQFLWQMEDGVGTNFTMLSLGGSLNHTAPGVLGLTSTDQSTTDDLFVLELNGAGGQSLTSTGTVSDPNHMLTLRLNTAAGASLASPVSFGKISWNSTNKGILTTNTTNVLTITNPSATNATVIHLPANNGYVSGPVRRATNSTDTYRFPTGNLGVYRFAEIIPATAAASVYGAEYIRSAHPNVLNVASPLVAVTNIEYWNVSRQSGSAAAVQLTLDGQLTGSQPADGIVAAQYTSSWVRTPGGAALTPGNVSAGVVRTGDLATFNNAFTLAYGPASALPIDLVSFTAKKLSGSAALLNWEVTASSTPDRFEVMRSTDGSAFTTIGTVQGVDQQTQYSYTDGSMPAGTVYYRLRLVDINGDVKLSKVVVLTNGTDGLFLTTMAPTIVIDRARVSVTSSQRGNLQLVITDMYGRIVSQQINGIDAGSQEIWLNLHSLARGAYQVTGYLDGKRSSSIRFIKQ